MLASIGGATAYYYGNVIIYQGDGHFSSCHGNNPDTGLRYEYSVNGNVNISGAPATVYALQQFTLTAWVENMTEVQYQGRDGNLILGISGFVADNDAFLKGLGEYGYERNVDTYNTTDRRGTTMTSVTFTLTAPATPATYTLMVTAMNAENTSAADPDKEETWKLLANGTVVIDVLANPPKSVAGLASSGDDDDDDDDAAGAISGYILIITLGTIFAISAVLILRMKKLTKKTNRNV